MDKLLTITWQQLSQRFCVIKLLSFSTGSLRINPIRKQFCDEYSSNRKDKSEGWDGESRNIDSQHRLSRFFRCFPAFSIDTHNSVHSDKLRYKLKSLGERRNNISINCTDIVRYS